MNVKWEGEGAEWCWGVGVCLWREENLIGSYTYVCSSPGAWPPDDAVYFSGCPVGGNVMESNLCSRDHASPTPVPEAGGPSRSVSPTSLAKCCLFLTLVPFHDLQRCSIESPSWFQRPVSATGSGMYDQGGVKVNTSAW